MLLAPQCRALRKSSSTWCVVFFVLSFWASRHVGSSLNPHTTHTQHTQIISSDRVPRLVATVADRHASLASRAAAAADLAESARSRRAYAEAAAAEGAAAAGTSLVRDATLAGDDDAADAGAALVGAVSGDAAASGGVTTLAIAPGVPAVTIVQASLSDGLGARLWAAAPALIAAVAGEARPRRARVPKVEGVRILELGAGTGAVGLAALCLGASAVDMTDGEAAVLAPARASAVATLRDEKQADDANTSLPPSCWRVGGACLHTLVWGGAVSESPPPPACSGSTDATPCPACAAAGPPPLPPDRRYTSILASDVFYEADGCAALATELAARLAPGGLALLACPVRENRLLEVFLAAADTANLAVLVERADWALAPAACRAGVEAAAPDYEGGFVFVDVERRLESEP